MKKIKCICSCRNSCTTAESGRKKKVKIGKQENPKKRLRRIHLGLTCSARNCTSLNLDLSDFFHFFFAML